MKLLVNIARIIVGILFIFSGLVKANDPLGLSYKMHEYFEVWHVTGFNSWTLPFSVLMNAFEIIAGFALLLGWRIRLFSWLLFLLIVFFTFLTGYTYYTGDPKNCGCFGDCLPITSKTSFLKDVVLTILIAFILWQKNKIKPILSQKANNIAMTLVTLFSFGLQWYALRYLPPVDCLPYKKGNDIKEKMKSPPGSVPDSFAIRFVYTKGGKDFEFSPSDFPEDLDTYEYKSRTDKLIRKGNAQPPIAGFSLKDASDVNFTDTVLNKDFAVLVFCENFETPFEEWKDQFRKVYEQAMTRSLPIYIITARPDEASKNFGSAGFNNLPILSCDNIVIRTAARTNPCFYLLNNGKVVEKQSYHHVDKIIDQFGNISGPIPVEIPLNTDTSHQNP